MYGDPADVAERIEIGEQRAIAIRERNPEPCNKSKPNFSLVSAATRRLINRTRIRELMKQVRR
jgi:hypothetical protein